MVLRVVDMNSKSVVVIHEPEYGYVFESSRIESAIDMLLTNVRAAVRAVAVERKGFEEVEGIDKAMVSRLSSLSKATGAITEPKIRTALGAYFTARSVKPLELDVQDGILNLKGPKVVIYNRLTGDLVLLDRDPDKHHVHRSTGVAFAWLEETLSPEMHNQNETFLHNKLYHWVIDKEARHYFLCATGAALFGGDTTNIKSSLLLHGEPDQAKSSLLNAVVAAGGWVMQSGCKQTEVNTSGVYSYSGADPNALIGKDKTLRSAMLTLTDGLRMVKFNELEATAVWQGVKGLANMEAQSVTKKKQSSGATSVVLVETPYAMLTCNKPPPYPPEDVKTKVVILTPRMLGRFVDGEGDGETTFKKVPRLDSSIDAVSEHTLLYHFTLSHKALTFT